MSEYESLRSLGWYEGRQVDISQIKEYLIEKGYSWFPSVQNFLSEFANLKSDKLNFDVIKAENDVCPSWILQQYANRLKTDQLCIIGQAYNNHLTLFMDASGNVYGGYDDFLCYISQDPKIAIFQIFTNAKFSEIS